MGNELAVGDALDIFRDFFKDLKVCYPSWRASIKSKDEDQRFKKQWLTAFAENGIDCVAKLDLGLVQARADESSWLPSVGQFIKWCKPSVESLGLPDVRVAYYEACNHQAGDGWSHDVVYFACKGILFNLQRLSEQAGFKLFERNYSIVVAKVLAGDDLGAVPVALPSPDAVVMPAVPMPDGFISDCLRG